MLDIEKLNDIKESIASADMLLIGIGTAWDTMVPGQNSGAEEYYRTIVEEESSSGSEILDLYNGFSSFVVVKPYFVVTMSTDDRIYESGFDPEHIVAPLGSAHMLQCDSHIMERFETGDIFRQLKLKGKKKSDGLTGEISNAGLPTCPVCGKMVIPNTIYSPGYLEAGYLAQWNEYTKWLSCTMNKKLCILELDVSFDLPSVIRFPFEKIVSYNKKATLIRINPHFPQIPADIAGKGISVKGSGRELLKEILA